MTSIEKRLNARITAQALLIEQLLATLDRAGLFDAESVVEKIEQFVDAPKADFVDAEEMRELAEELDGWADMINVTYIERS